MSSKQPSRLEVLGRAATLAITNLTKLSGLFVAMREIVTHSTPHTTVLALAAFMMAGATFSERVLMAAIDRFFGKPPASGSE